MAGVDMSLDDIISLNRKNRKFNGNPRRGGFAKRSFGGGARKPLNRNNFVYRDLDNPEKTFVSTNFIPSRERGNALVRLNLSNLAPSVSSADLEELFARYDTIEAATVHYNELGESLGTGDVYLSKREALKIMRNFDGVALDNRILQMNILDSQDGNRPASRDRVKPIGRISMQRTNKFKNQSNRNTSGSSGRQGGGRQKPKTMEELDAELDAYMQKSK